MGVFFSDEEIRMFGSKSIHKPVAYALFLFGAGYCGQLHVHKCSMLPGFAGFLDNNPALDGTFVAGQEVYHPSRIAAACAGRTPMAILAALDGDIRESMRQDCLRLGIKCVAYEDFDLTALFTTIGTVDDLLQDETKALYLYGKGHLVDSLVPKVKRYKAFKGILDPQCDKNSGDGESYLGAPVFHPGILKAQGRGGLLVRTAHNKFYLERYFADCRSYGCTPVSNEILSLAASMFNREFAFYEACEAAVKCLDIWADDESKHVYRSLIRTRCFRNPLFLPDRNTEQQYFSPVVPRKCYRSFVDCGGGTGTSLNNFRKIIGDDFDSYHVFEVFPPNYRAVVRTADADPRIRCWNMALWNKRTELSFRVPTENHYCCPTIARDAAGGNAVVQGDSLDQILGDWPVTMIAMDIEGAEPEALEGAIGIIRRQRPALAISTYHSDADQSNSHLWRIPLWIHGLDLGYSLYCRHYSYNLTETICYAVPNN